MKTLPDKPSELIRHALADLALAEASDDYVIDMSEWHEPDEDTGVCAVCLAGSVMAFSLDLPVSDEYGGGSWDGGIDAKMQALNRFRLGDLWRGLDWLNVPNAMSRVKDMRSGGTAPIVVPDYRDDPKAFREAMNKMADGLEEIGL